MDALDLETQAAEVLAQSARENRRWIYACIASGSLHGAVVAIAAVGITVHTNDHAALAGKQNVIHMQLSQAAVAASDASMMSMGEVQVSREPVPEESVREEPVMREQPTEDIAKAELSPPEFLTSQESSISLEPPADITKPVSFERKQPEPEQPKPLEVDRPFSRQSIAQLPLPALVAVVPETAGTDESQPPDLQGNQPPAYPELALQRGWHGTVWLRLHIDALGKIVQVEIERSSGYEILDEEALRAVRLWKAQPATRRGKPVETVEILPVKFVK